MHTHLGDSDSPVDGKKADDVVSLSEWLGLGLCCPYQVTHRTAGFCRIGQTREAATARRGEFEAWLEDELDEVVSEDLIDPQHFLRWQLSLGRDVRDRFEDLPELVELTGTNGRRQRYSVIPSRSDGLVRWIDPAGFELAQSDDIFDEFGPSAIHSDFELRTEGAEARVHRIFVAGR